MKRIFTGALLVALCLMLRGQSPVVADIAAWQPIESLSGVSVTALALSPNYEVDHTVFAGLRGRGVYRTGDSGDTWQLAGLPDQVIVDLAISPAYATDRTLFAAVGLPNSGFNVYRSNDGGQTWQPPYLTPDSDNFHSITALSLSPDFATDHTLYVIGASATYKSNDGGLQFFKSSGWFGTHHVTHLIFSPVYAADHTLFAAVQNDQVYKSIDGGSLWNPTGLGGDAQRPGDFAQLCRRSYAGRHHGRRWTTAPIDGSRHIVDAGNLDAGRGRSTPTALLAHFCKRQLDARGQFDRFRGPSLDGRRRDLDVGRLLYSTLVHL